MKKLIALVLALTSLFTFVSITSAAVTVGGNLRVWYQAANDETQSPNVYNGTFRFDLLALSINADLSSNNGINGEIQFRQVDKNTVSTSGTPSGSTDIRLNNVYYYQRSLFSNGDELDIGYIKLPFNNDKAYKALYTGSLGYNARLKNSVGINYSGKIEAFEYALALANANNASNYNTPPNVDGLDSAIRLSYAPIQALKIGLGFVNDATNSSKTDTKLAFDTTYGFGPFGIFAEYIAVTPQSKDTQTGIDFEGSYQLADPIIIYGGRAVSTSNGGNNGAKLTKAIGPKIAGGPGGNDFKLTDDWTFLGVKYQLTPKTALQGEILQQDSEKTKQVLGLRLKIDF